MHGGGRGHAADRGCRMQGGNHVGEPDAGAEPRRNGRLQMRDRRELAHHGGGRYLDVAGDPAQGRDDVLDDPLVLPDVLGASQQRCRFARARRTRQRLGPQPGPVDAAEVLRSCPQERRARVAREVERAARRVSALEPLEDRCAARHRDDVDRSR